MEDKQMKEFSWTAFFLVTGFSFLAFGKGLQLLDRIQLPVFNWIALICLLIGSLNSIRSFIMKTEEQ